MAEETNGSIPVPTGSQTPVASADSPSVTPANPDTPHKDVAMTDAPTDQASPANASPVPARTATPAQASRAPSVHPEPGFSMPAEAPPHGDSTRRYLNTKVTGALLEGMKLLAKDQPEDPLRVLGEFLIQKSKELEGSN